MKQPTFESLEKKWRENQSKYMVGVNCAHELAELRKEVEKLRDRWLQEQLDYPQDQPDGAAAAAAVRLCARELTALLGKREG